jgi:integrase
MGHRYVVRIVVFQSGERFPVLLDRGSGAPLFDPTLFAVTQIRGRNRATATIEQALRAVMVLHVFLDASGIDLPARLQEGRLLELGELEELARHCRLPVDALEVDTAPMLARASKLMSLEKFRMRPSAPKPEVHPATAAVRLGYIRDYLRWLATHRLLQRRHGDPVYSALLNQMELVLGILKERAPGSGRGTKHREGLSPETVGRLERVIDPTFAGNPWTGAHARERNALMVRWLLSLGLRRGELLGIRIPDINFQTNEVLIVRRADDPADPRKYQPNAKTNARLLPLDDALSHDTRRYILGARRNFEGARKHDFLFVASGTGAPLTLVAVNKLFAALREKCPELPEDLSPHVLRHTWNDRFSEIMDRHRVSEETEKKARSRLMGWSETSNTAATYTRRHIQNKAREASLQLQKSMRRSKQNGH